MALAVDIFRYDIFIKSTETENDPGLKCNYVNWIQMLEKKLLKVINLENLLICSNDELKDKITQIISQDKFKGKKIPIINLDRRSAELGYYFSHLRLSDIQEKENVILVEVARATSSGYVYQYDNHTYKLRNRINVSNSGKECEITEGTFNQLIENLVGDQYIKHYIIVYEDSYLRCQDQIKQNFSKKQYQLIFIPWSKTDGCDGLLKKVSFKENFPAFDNKCMNSISTASSAKTNEIEHGNKDEPTKRPSKMSCQDNLTPTTSYTIPKPVNQYTSRTSIIGFDFGTTKCSAAVSRNSQIEVVQDNDGNRSFNSCIAFDQPEPIVGNAASKKLKDKPQYVVYDIKRIIGKSKVQDVKKNNCWSFGVTDSENGVDIVAKTRSDYGAFSPVDLSAILFKEMKNKASEFQGVYGTKNSTKEAVITVPSFFNDKEREAIQKAAELAGIKVLDLLDEPVAVALQYIASKKRAMNSSPFENQNILVFNLGGGMLDISVLQAKGDKLIEIGKAGNPCLGGKDFDTVLAEHVSTIMENKYQIKVESLRQKHKLISMVEAVKTDLTVTDKSTFYISEFCDDVSTVIDVTRKEFEELSKNLLHQISLKVKEALRQPELKIDQVVYIGGGSKMPMIKNMLKALFPESEHYYGADSEYTAAVGACIHGLQLYEDRN